MIQLPVPYCVDHFAFHHPDQCARHELMQKIWRMTWPVTLLMPVWFPLAIYLLAGAR